MAIHVVCPECGKGVNAPDHFAGKRARCPACKAVLNVPASEVEDDRGYEIVGEDARNSVSSELPPTTAASAWRPIQGTSAQTGDAWTRRIGAKPTASTLRHRSLSRAGSNSGRDRVYWLLVFALVPLGFSLLGGEEDTAARFEQTLEHNPEVAKQLRDSKKKTLDDLLEALPGGRIEGAFLSRNSWMHWGYATLSAAGFFGLMVMFFRRESAPPASLILVGLFTGTIGILLLLGVQWASVLSQGVWLRGRGVVILIFLFVKFIGFSYTAALDDSNGFLLSFFGFTCGVGFCEELCKALPLIMEYRRRSTLGWRGAYLWGLASGVGFGVSEGITYASDHYNGVATWGIYVVRFVSCVALHAMWSSSVGILIFRDQALIGGSMDWTDWFRPLAKFLGVSIVLHGLYDTMLKRDMNAAALVVAVASFAWMVWLIERTRREELSALEEAMATA